MIYRCKITCRKENSFIAKTLYRLPAKAQVSQSGEYLLGGHRSRQNLFKIWLQKRRVISSSRGCRSELIFASWFFRKENLVLRWIFIESLHVRTLLHESYAKICFYGQIMKICRLDAFPENVSLLLIPNFSTSADDRELKLPMKTRKSEISWV